MQKELKERMPAAFRKVSWKRYGLYLIRWQLSTPILAAALVVLSSVDKVTATIVANLIGGLIFSGLTGSSSPRSTWRPSGR
jgi:bacteriorhodopsin